MWGKIDCHRRHASSMNSMWMTTELSSNQYLWRKIVKLFCNNSISFIELTSTKYVLITDNITRQLVDWWCYKNLPMQQSTLFRYICGYWDINQEEERSCGYKWEGASHHTLWMLLHVTCTHNNQPCIWLVWIYTYWHIQSLKRVRCIWSIGTVNQVHQTIY